MSKHTVKELQAICNHNYALRTDTWLRYMCCGCGVKKFKWNWIRLKRLKK